MAWIPLALGVRGSGGPRRRLGARRSLGGVLVVASAVLVVASGCTSDRAAPATPNPTEATATTEAVVVTVPAVPPTVGDCGTTNELAGWPTTTTTPPGGYACILDALAAGTPAQMSVIAAGSGDSGRKTRDGYDIPTKRVFTWLVLGEDEIEETADLTEDGGASTTRICTAMVVDGPRPQGTGCS